MNVDTIDFIIKIIANCFLEGLSEERITKIFTKNAPELGSDEINLLIVAGETLYQHRKNLPPPKSMIKRLK